MLRISAGEFKGLTFTAPDKIRPTEAKVRQALFNILSQVLPGARVLDGYAGSGALGLEALSQGASFVTFIEQDTECVLAIRDNLDKLGPALPRGAFRVVQADFTRGLERLEGAEAPFDLILADPPYRTEEPTKALHAVAGCAILAPAGFLVVEHDRRADLPKAVGLLSQIKQHRYGATVLSFYQAALAPGTDR